MSEEPEQSSSTERDDSGLVTRRDDVCVHIVSTSATLVGVCLTVIGLLRIDQHMNSVGTAADNILSLTAVGFLASCALAYAAVRNGSSHRRRVLEVAADIAFISALASMAVVCGLLAFEFL